MSTHLQVSIGQHSDKGRKDTNQDFHGACIPEGSQLEIKGVAVAIADGISSSDVSHIASQTTVKTFLEDYYCTSDAWTVKSSAARVLSAANSWLYSQTQRSDYRFDKDRGYVCTFSALILHSNTAHLFHIGDSRIYRLNEQDLQQLTDDHRVWASGESVSEGACRQSYLSRAMGVEPYCELDYQALRVSCGDVFILATDGVYEFVDAGFIAACVAEQGNDLDAAAAHIVEQAYQQGSGDNLSVQIVRIDQLPEQNASEVQRQIEELPFPPELDARMAFDGYTIIRQVHASSRSHVFLAKDEATDTQVILKTPSVDLRADPDYLERFLMEEWIARRINSVHVLKSSLQQRKRNYIYTVTEFIEGQTLAQWLIDNPKPDLETVRGIIEQVAKGLRAFHRMEMLHQDLKPDNIMIDQNGTVKIIDFGSTRVAGLLERMVDVEQHQLLGTALYSGPEYFIGEPGSARSDQFSLGVLTYYLLSGRFPYGTKVAGAKSRAAQRRLQYTSVLDDEREIPAWVDEALKKAVHVDPYKRYEAISEFLTDLRRPSQAFLNKTRPPLMERDPVVFWQSVSAVLALIVIFLLNKLY